MSEAAQKALERLPEYQRSTEPQLQNKEDSLQNETEHSTSDRPRLELKGLEEYRRLRNENISPNEISRQLSETARWGNEGKKNSWKKLAWRITLSRNRRLGNYW